MDDNNLELKPPSFGALKSRDRRIIEIIDVEESSSDEIFTDALALNNRSDEPTAATRNVSKENWKTLMSRMQQNQKEVLENPSKKVYKRKQCIKTTMTGNNQQKRQKFTEIDNNHLAQVDPNSTTSTSTSSFPLVGHSSSSGGVGVCKVHESKAFVNQNEPKDYFRIGSGFGKPSSASAATAITRSSIRISNKFNNDEENYEDVIGWSDTQHTIITLNQITKENTRKPSSKSCPFYKKIPGTSFCVDAFSYGVIPGISVYFLSHFHSDHYMGLGKSFGKTLVCDSGTGNLVSLKLGVADHCIKRLELNRVYEIEGVKVVIVNANHCPGSVMFIFRFQNGNTIIHTGDFRFTPSMLSNPFIAKLSVDTLYLDTTYCNPKYNFPRQKDTIQQVVDIVTEAVSRNPMTLIVCGAYSIGKERVFFSLAETLGTKVYCPPDKYAMLSALENPDFRSYMTNSESSATIHVLPMRNLHTKCLSDYLAHRKNLYTKLIAIKPSGWEFSNSSVQDNGFSSKTYNNNTLTIIGVPYSEHSSYSELREFVSQIKPKRVQPTVNVGNEAKRNEMMTYINSWLRP